MVEEVKNGPSMASKTVLETVIAFDYPFVKVLHFCVMEYLIGWEGAAGAG